METTRAAASVENGNRYASRDNARRGRAPAGVANRSLPHSIEAEESLLGALFIDAADVVPRCLKAGIGAESFYDSKHGVIFETALRVFAAQGVVDLAVVAEELKAGRRLEEVGGYPFLVQVSGRVPTTASVGYFVDKIREQAILRATIRSAAEIIEQAHNFTSGIEEFCATAEEKLAQVARARVGAGRASRSALPRLLPWGGLVGAQQRAEPPQMVAGLVHRGSKVMLGGGSKSFKTWCLMDLGLSVATGAPWWGLRTTQSRVLYVNFELQPWSFEARTRSICEAKRIPLVGAGAPENFVSWHLRGYASDLSELIPQFLVNTVGSGFDMIILDPIYKCLGDRDENANGEVAGLLNEVEALAVRSDAAVVFGHHFSKGNQATKDSRDRVSGAGAWTRDPDTVITLTPHEEEECFAAEFVLRDLKPRSPMVVRWQFPCMVEEGKMDPSALRQAGRPTEHTVATLVGLLEDEGARSVNSGLTCSKLEQLAKSRKDMSKSTFFRKLEEAVKAGRIERAGTFYFVSESSGLAAAA